MKKVVLAVLAIASLVVADDDPPKNTNLTGKVIQVQKFESSQTYGSDCPGGSIKNVVFIKIEGNGKVYQVWANESSKTLISMALSALSMGSTVDIQTDQANVCAGNYNLSILNIKN